jgi:hypothetical protein
MQTRVTHVTNAQRALWTFLIYALVGPFFAALAVTALVALGSLFGISGPVAGALPPVGAAALQTFVWSAVPAMLSGLALAAFVFRAGGFSWIAAGAVGVIAFAMVSTILPPWLEDARPYLAFLAGLVAVGVRQVLTSARILPA